MKTYGQFCPVAKSAEIIGDPWSILIVRELLLGSSRFGVLQQGMPRISPTMLSLRLRQLEARGVILKRKIRNLRGYEYHLTPSGRELSAVVEALAVWGMRWARSEMSNDDLDVSFLMFDVQRRIDLAALPDGETVLGFIFTDLSTFGNWWLVCANGEVDLCYSDPGKEVDCYITTTSREMICVWMGDIPLTQALARETIQLVGEKAICRSFTQWFRLAMFAATPRPTQAERAARA